MSDAHLENDAQTTDAELLSRLRSGDASAYIELWRRHVKAALRVAHHVAPGQAEDLVAESFTAVFNQITRMDNGPESAFRAYLFTTMRNTAVRWQAAARLVDTDPDIDQVLHEDGLSRVEDRAESATILAAFQDLPERWQRVLWLSEVEEVDRSTIAADLNIKPNAVSALLRRARHGLQLSWLNRQIPEALRDTREHVAHLLPELILRQKVDVPLSAIKSHLASCAQCAEVEAELRTGYRSMRRGTLGAAGFAALGITLPYAGQVPVAVAAASIGIASLTALAASVALVIATGVVVGDAVFSGAQSTAAQADGQQSADGEGTRDGGRDDSAGSRDGSNQHSARGSGQESSTGSPEPEIAGEPVETINTLPGRHNTDPSVPSVDIADGGEPSDFYVPPERPTPAPPGTVPDPNPTNTDSSLTPGLATPSNLSGYLAPVLSGSTAPATSIAIAFERRPDSFSPSTYAEQFLTSADDQGGWSFDTRTVYSEAPGTYDYRVWAFTPDEVSSVHTGEFTLSAPAVQGFPIFDVFDPDDFLPLNEASSTGIVFTAAGSANGQICLHSPSSGQEVDFALDGTGSATQRLRFLAPGIYSLVFRACEGEFRGPASEQFVDVENEASSPFGFGLPDEDEPLWFELEPVN